MSLYIGIAIAVVVIIAIIAIAVAVGVRRRRSQQLRQNFGPEYDRTVAATGNTGAAERELQARQERRRTFNLRPLGAVERQRYTSEWTVVQQRFVDAPHQALAEADRLVGSVMSDRGYPMHDFERTADDVSVDHPHEVSDYRAAHAVAQSGDRATTEDMRIAMQRYRSLFESLLRDETPQGEAAGGAPAAGAPAGGAATGGAPMGRGAPAGGAPAGGAPMGGGAPAGGAPTGDAPMGGGPAGGAPAPGAPRGGAPTGRDPMGGDR